MRPANIRSSHQHHDEETPLLRGPTDSSPRWVRLRKHLTQDVSRNWADVVLLFCYVITGLLDSCAVFIWGSFVSMQTGMVLGLRSISPPVALTFERKYRLCGPRNCGSNFKHPMGQIPHIHSLLLPWIILLQSLSSFLFTPAPMGSHSLVQRSASIHPVLRAHRHLYFHQRHGPELACPRPNRLSSISKLWPGRHQPSFEVRRVDICGSHQQLLRSIFRPRPFLRQKRRTKSEDRCSHPALDRCDLWRTVGAQ